MNRQVSGHNDIVADLQRSLTAHDERITRVERTYRESAPIPLISGGTPAFPPTDPLPYERVTLVGDASKGVNFELIYNAAEATYDWESIGGSEIYAEVNTRETPTVAGAFADLPTAGSSLTTPRSGDYLVEAICMAESSAAAANRMGMGISIAGAAPTATEQQIAHPIYGLNAQNGYATILVRRVLTLTAGNVLKMQYFVAVIAGSFFQNRRIFMRPIRIS